MTARLLRGYPYLLAAAACAGLSCANAVRGRGLPVAAAAVCAALAAAFAAESRSRVVLLAAALALTGWWWGSVRLAALDASVLLLHVGESDQALVETTGPARQAGFSVRVPARMLRFGELAVREPILLELPPGRAPPQGARLELRRPDLASAALPRTDSTSGRGSAGTASMSSSGRASGGWWDVAAGSAATPTASADGLPASIAPGLGGERRALLEGIVLGEDQGLSDGLRTSFRASGLYHLLAVSGQNVIFIAAGVLGLAYLARRAALAGRARGARRDRIVRARGRRAAVGDPGGDRRRARLAGLAVGAAARPVALPADRRARAARLEPVQPARRRASSSRSRRWSRSSSPPRGSSGRSRAIRCRAGSGTRSPCRSRAGWRPRRSCCSSSARSRSTPCRRTRSPRRWSGRCSGSRSSPRSLRRSRPASPRRSPG